MDGWWWRGAETLVGPAEFASFVFLVLFKDGGPSESPKLHLFVSEVNQKNEEAV